MSKFIYFFQRHNGEGNSQMKQMLGSKGAGLAEMCNLGLNIPAGFTIATNFCQDYYNNSCVLPANFTQELQLAISRIEQASGKIFGGDNNPLLLSVRSGSQASMPGMMDTILNLGINDKIVHALSVATNDEEFAYDIYRRFIEMYSRIVLKIPYYYFEEIFEAYIFSDLKKVDSLKKIIEEYKKVVKKQSHEDFPDDPYIQLQSAIKAVLESWMNDRAVTYRKLNNIPESWGTAVNIQTMVFGNYGDNSATGVVFTRSPSKGTRSIYGEFLINAQGEDIVSGIRTPVTINSSSIGDSDDVSMQKKMPALYDQLQKVCDTLELHFKDSQDIEFTIESGQLYILQTRSAKRTATAAIKIAVDMVLEGILTKEQALMRVAPDSLSQLLHAYIDYSKQLELFGQGLPASPGAATGIVVFSPYDAEEMAHHHSVILVRNDTSPDDIKGMHVSAGLLTARGGMTSHAAVVARGMGKPCVCGVSNLIIDEENNLLKIGEIIVKKGDEITIDGSTGKIFLGKAPLTHPDPSVEFITFLQWADEVRNIEVRANAETSLDAATAIKFGAEGIGLCRTEHMFFDQEKIPLIREMIVATDYEHRKKAIDKLLPLQIADFKQLFRVLEGKPINIRLLDPPLHEFLPNNITEMESLANESGLPLKSITSRLNALHEVNPMLGHRGCRLGITYPEIYQMQLQAIFVAIKDLAQEEKVLTRLEIMIPLVSDARELQKIKHFLAEILHDNSLVNIGSMIELPRAALLAESIAREVDFFSFGTNDLTQTTYGISRDDIASFLPDYLEQQVFTIDPFVELDEQGVGELIKIAISLGKKGNPKLKLGVCGEHAGNPKSIDFFYQIGIDYISCSPYRVPIARLAAAQSKIQHKQNLSNSYES
ncbi:MAG: pyruvate, phosphate dikinase [Rickettsiaceae bacterium]|nr:MAG: pyruvate, phosphate dikinase [Rickettsiaceae bacterium]